jgi:hypothetical protein
LVVGLLGFGGWHLLKGVPRLLRRNPELDWHTVPGVVTESYIEGREEGGGMAGKAQLEYRYRVGDIEFVGDKLGPLTGFSGLRWSAEMHWNKYPRGSAVTVFYNPRNPGEAVLEPGEQKGIAALVSLAGVFWCVLAILFVICH